MLLSALILLTIENFDELFLDSFLDKPEDFSNN